jgi:hypothetical protein
MKSSVIVFEKTREGATWQVAAVRGSIGAL